MNIKNVLLASTALFALGATAAPAAISGPVQPGVITVAQTAPPALAGAIATYRDAQAGVSEAEASGEGVEAAQEALAAAEGELGTLCASLGQNDIEACIAMFESGGAATEAEPQAEVEAEAEAQVEAEAPAQPEAEAPAEPEAEAPAEPEAEAPAEPEAAPEPQPEAEQPAEPEAQAEPAPEAEPQPEAQAEPEPEQQPEAAEPQAEPEQQPEEPAEAETDAQVDAGAQAETEVEAEAEAQPEPEAQPEAAPVEAEQAEPETRAGADVPPRLADAIGAYEQAVADYDAAVAGEGDVEGAVDAVLSAEADIQALCEALGQGDIASCLAGFGVELEIIDPTVPEAGAETPEAAPADEQPAAEAPAEEAPAGEASGEDRVTEEGDLAEVLPETVNEEDVAPLLDSEKDAAAATTSRDPEAEAEAGAEAQADAEVQAEAEQPAEPEADADAEAQAQAASEPAPETDEDAQRNVVIENIISINEEAGTRRTEDRAEGETAVTAEEREEAELVGRVPPEGSNILDQIGLSVIFEYNNNVYIESPDTPRYWYEDDQDYYIEDLPNGRTREVILRADGSQIVTIRDRWGEVVRRSRITPDGREILLVYVDDSYQRYDDQGRWIDPGQQLPPLRLTIPAREYVLDASAADQQQVATFLDQPPVEQLQRTYTIDEVKRSARVRDIVRRLEIGDLTFETASASIRPDEIDALSEVANAMIGLLEQDPGETFLIEGHTDAVGDDLYNLSLSDQRAQAVANALTTVYGIPPENLATQGYGERYLKVNTSSAEELNRRVTIRRITPLITPVTTAAAG